MRYPPAPTAVTAVGVDDFALRRGHVYGTVVIDINSQRPLELLPDRTADTVAAWLKTRPEVRVVCRDRAGGYAEAARLGAPDAIQVADRWHLWHNLAQAVERTVAVHRADLHPPAEPDGEQPTAAPDQHPEPAPAADTESAQGRLVQRTLERYAAVQRLRGQGRSISAVGRELGLDRRTARRFARAKDVRSCWARPGPARACSMRSSPTCMSDSTRGTPTPPH